MRVMQLSGIMGKYNCNAISFDDILLQEYSWIMEKEIAIYHGSNKIIRKPVYGAGNPFNDYGRRIYCTPDVEFAKEWAVSNIQYCTGLRYYCRTVRLIFSPILERRQKSI